MKTSKFTTRQMALDAVLAAICMVLGYYGPDLGNLKITFEGLPVILAGLLLGPLDGAAVGGIGTLLYQLLRYGVSATTLLWILPYVLCGLVVGRIGDRCAPEKSFGRLALTVLAGEGLIFLLNTGIIWLDSKIYGYYSFAYVFGSFFVRLGICGAKTVLYAAVLPTLMAALRRAGAPNRKTLQRKKARDARKAMTEEERRAASEAICARLLEMPAVQKARTILSYEALPEEADLSLLHETLGGSVRLCFPVSLAGGVMEAWEPGAWKQGRYGIREPDREDWVIGVRPEFIRISEDGPVEGEVFSAMPTGMETTVRIRVGNYLLTGVVFGGVTYKLGQKVRISFTGSGATLFSRVNGRLVACGEVRMS